MELMTDFECSSVNDEELGMHVIVRGDFHGPCWAIRQEFITRTAMLSAVEL